MPIPHPRPALLLTHDLLRVLSMDTWWTFGHELKQNIPPRFPQRSNEKVNRSNFGPNLGQEGALVTQEVGTRCAFL